MSVEVDDKGKLVVETIHWLDESNILLGCSLIVNGEEDSAAYLRLVTLKNGAVDPSKLMVYSVDIMTIEVLPRTPQSFYSLMNISVALTCSQICVWYSILMPLFSKARRFSYASS